MDPENLQLSFDVGGAEPTCASLRLTGSIGIMRQFEKGDMMGVRVVDADGQIIFSGDGRVTGIAFNDRLDKQGNVSSTERVHKVTLT